MEEQLELLDPEEEVASAEALRIAQAVVHLMQEHKHVLWQDSQTHAEEHSFIRELIIEARAKAAMLRKKESRRERIIDRITGSIIISAVLAFTAFIGAGSIDWIRGHLK